MPESLLAAAMLLISIAAQVPVTDPADTPPAAQQIHVDEHCRVLSQDRISPEDTRTRPAFRTDPGVCRLENQLHSSHIRETVEEGVLTRTRIDNYQATFILTNPTANPVTFVVDQTLPRGWKLESSTTPDKTSDTLATFHVNARGGQTVSLRVEIHD